MNELQKHNGGRPPFEITEDVLKKVETFAAQGLTREQIAHCLDVAPSTLYKKKAQNIELTEAIEAGKAKGVATISNALFGTAKEGHFPAQRYYLQNRAPEAWKDSTDIVHKGDVKIVHEVIVVSEIDRWVGDVGRQSQAADGQKALPDGSVLPAVESL